MQIQVLNNLAMCNDILIPFERANMIYKDRFYTDVVYNKTCNEKLMVS